MTLTHDRAPGADPSPPEGPTGAGGSPGGWVQTKLYLPTVRSAVVDRPRLRAALGRGAAAKLVVISAPAGFGKTTMLAGWAVAAAAAGRSVAWLSLDENDRRPSSFWGYVITALQRAVPGVGAGVLALLQAGRRPTDTVLGALLNELSALPNETDLVLDDYHLVDGPDLRPGLEFLLEHLPPRLHVVMSTRADPQLPLARLRARGELVEIRAADLRFTADEVAAYLNDVAGLNLAASDVATLEDRTEGWIAALQLAALSLRGRTDVSGFIAGFAGDDRYIVDYLVEEVLERQAVPVRVFLLRTCLLDRLSGPLCDAVTGGTDGKAMLEALDRANLFVVPLDDNRHWYRYHHLFADMLRAHLTDELPDEAPELHRRASLWYAANGQAPPAVRHALAADDIDRAADLIETAIPELRRTRQDAVIRGWLDAIPYQVVRMRPVLAIGLVGGLMVGAETEGVEERLRDAERWLRPGSGAGMAVVDAAEFDRLPGAIAMYRAALALIGGDRPATLRHARQAVERAAADDDAVRAGAAGLSGLAWWYDGALEAAHRAYGLCVEGLRRAGSFSDVLGCSIALADIRTTQGRLDDALCTYQQALHRSSFPSRSVLRGTADMYVGMSQIACQRGDLHQAQAHLLRSQELGEHAGLVQNPYRWRVAMAGIRIAQHDLPAALTLLDDAQRVYLGDFSPNVRPIPALRARVQAAQGNLAPALDWAREQGLSVGDTLSYLRAFEHLTLARVLLARSVIDPANGSLPGVRRLLERLHTSADTGGRTGTVIEILVQQSLTHRASGDTGSALTALEKALTLAEPEKYVRVFLDEGRPIAALMTMLATARPRWEYVHRLLAAGIDENGGPSGAPFVDRMTRPGTGLVAPMSGRELQVLHLLATELDGPAIARRLFISLNTLRSHTKSIYAKLGVNSRRAAVHQAQTKGLLAGTLDR